MTDRGATLFRVHMFGDHVISIFVLYPRPGSRSDRHCARCNGRSVHVLDRLVN